MSDFDSDPVTFDPTLFLPKNAQKVQKVTLFFI